MNPDTGQLYPSRRAALDDGVENPVELTGRPKDVVRIARAVQQSTKARERERKRRQMAKNSRKANRS